MGNEKSTSSSPSKASRVLEGNIKYKNIFTKYCKEDYMTKECLQNLFQPLQKVSSLFCFNFSNGFQEQDFMHLLQNFGDIYNDEQRDLFYLNLISNLNDSTIQKSGLQLLINACCDASFLMIAYTNKSESNFIDSVLQTFSKHNGGTESCNKFLNKNIPNLTRDLHIHVSNCFHGASHRNTLDRNKFQLIHSIESGKSILSMEGLWLVYSVVPYSYIPVVSSSSMPLMQELISLNCWNCIYQSNQDGLSLNRLKSIITSYKAPSLFYVSFEKYLFCIGNDVSWSESKDKIGGPDAFLLHLLPDYSLVLAGSNIIYCNFTIKSIPQGIQIGSSSKSIILKIDEDLSFIEYFGAKYPIAVIEIWGCGGMKAIDNLHKQKQWEKNEALKIQNKKLNLENWEDSPDKLILDMGGVKTEHNQRD